MNKELTRDEMVATCLRVLNANEIDYPDEFPLELLDELERAEVYKQSLEKWVYGEKR